MSSVCAQEHAQCTACTATYIATTGPTTRACTKRQGTARTMCHATTSHGGLAHTYLPRRHNGAIRLCKAPRCDVATTARQTIPMAYTHTRHHTRRVRGVAGSSEGGHTRHYTRRVRGVAGPSGSWFQLLRSRPAIVTCRDVTDRVDERQREGVDPQHEEQLRQVRVCATHVAPRGVQCVCVFGFLQNISCKLQQERTGCCYG